MGLASSGQNIAAVASDIYHNHFEEFHQACEDFQKSNNYDSVNKLMHLLGQLHSAAGANYLYNADVEYPQVWLMSNGKTIMTQLITDAEAANMEKAAKSFKNICSELEVSHLVQ